jgi:hypothetical protein
VVPDPLAKAQKCFLNPPLSPLSFCPFIFQIKIESIRLDLINLTTLRPELNGPLDCLIGPPRCGSKMASLLCK